MNGRINRIAAILAAMLLLPSVAHAGVATAVCREVGEFIFHKFGKGVAGETIEAVTEATAKAVAKYGDDVLPFLRKSGHAGFTALEEAGEKAPEVLKLFARNGDDAIRLISDPKKLSIFLKHGDSAADALLKHPGIADNLIGRYGDDAAGALNAISRQSAQTLGMIAEDGVLDATQRSRELLPVIRKYGDEAMDFIWKHKGSLAVASLLATFLADPQAYISGAKGLVVSPIVGIVHWTLIVVAAFVVACLLFVFVVRSVIKARKAPRSTGTTT